MPVLLDGNSHLPIGEKLYEFLTAAFVEQYDSPQPDEYRQLNPSRRVVIVDNYDKLQMGNEKKRQFTSALTKYAKTIVLIATEMDMACIDLTNPVAVANDAAPFAYYRILPFNHVLRNRLVEKWLHQDGSCARSSEAYYRNVERVTRFLDVAIGKNFVPAYPVYILAVLQAVDAGTQLDLGASSHGYYYQLLIQDNLARGASKSSYDLYLSYLPNLAYFLFCRKTKSCLQNELMSFHREYEIRFALHLDLEEMKADMEKKHILIDGETGVRFKYPYLLYYFMAMYMRDHIAETDIADRLNEMSQHLYVEANANTVLFLAHLSKDSRIVSAVLCASEQLYPSTQEAMLDDDVAFLNDVDNVARKLSFQEEDTGVSREVMLKQKDELEAAVYDDGGDYEIEFGPESTRDDEFRPLRELNSALKTMQILGQLLKNFPGSMEGPEKLRILQACTSVGLRCLGSFFGMVKANENDLLQIMFNAVRHHHPKMDEYVAKCRAASMMVGLMKLVSTGLVLRTAWDIGSPYLAVTYSEAFSGHMNPAYQLISLGVDLEHAGGFPAKRVKDIYKQLRGNKHAVTVLKFMVINHFYMFPASYQLRQSICQTLGIEYIDEQSGRKMHKLLPRPKRGTKRKRIGK